MGTTTASKRLFFLLLLPLHLFAAPFFTVAPPPTWRIANPAKLSPRVKVGFVSNKKNSFVPSLNLAMEPLTISQENYLEEVKKLHKAKRENQVTDMGTVKTRSGDAHLLQIEAHKTWGTLLILQSILVKDHCAYIITGVSSKEDFPTTYQEFISTFSSFELKDSPFEFVVDVKKREELKAQYATIEAQLAKIMKEKNLGKESAFGSKEFSKKVWNPYQKYLQTKFKDLGIYFPSLMLSYTKEQMLT